MNWTIPVLTIVAIIHVAAVVAGRASGSLQQRVAFASGILGLLSIPLVILVGLMSICIAGGCGHGFDVADLAAIVFVAVAVSSLISLVLIGVRRTRA